MHSNEDRERLLKVDVNPFLHKSNSNRLIFLFSLSTFSQYRGLMLKTYSSRLIFHLPFPFIFSQSPIISLQSPIERGDITSPFPYIKGGKSICWNTSFIYIEIEKENFPIWWEKENGKINPLAFLQVWQVRIIELYSMRKPTLNNTPGVQIQHGNLNSQ